MSLNVLVIPEDGRYDQHLVKPLVTGLLASLGKGQARVQVHPGLGGYGRLLQWAQLRQVVDQYRGMTQLFIVCTDRDGDPDRCGKIRELERQAGTLLVDRPDRRLFGVAAVEEVEVWLLAVAGPPKDVPWQTVRSEKDAKEKYFRPFLDGQDPVWRDKHDHGLKAIGARLASDAERVCQLCPEVNELRERLHDFLHDTA